MFVTEGKYFSPVQNLYTLVGTSDLVSETFNPANRFAALIQYAELQSNNIYTP